MQVELRPSLRPSNREVTRGTGRHLPHEPRQVRAVRREELLWHGASEARAIDPRAVWQLVVPARVCVQETSCLDTLWAVKDTFDIM